MNDISGSRDKYDWIPEADRGFSSSKESSPMENYLDEKCSHEE